MISFAEDPAEGTATVHFTQVRGLNITRTDGRVDEVLVTVPRSSYRASRSNEQRAAELLKKALDDALSQVERLSDERDEWQERAERGEEVLAKYPQPLWSVDTLRRNLFVIPDEGAATVDELKAVIVSQAREIARLKREGE
ncbi:hypothetical protein J3S85_37810 [Streptomyces lavenduligriseus]|nr:hypothetical protein J3S85_37810 [Streptomyces lavenduligriseus]